MVTFYIYICLVDGHGTRGDVDFNISLHQFRRFPERLIGPGHVPPQMLALRAASDRVHRAFGQAEQIVSDSVGCVRRVSVQRLLIAFAVVTVVGIEKRLSFEGLSTFSTYWLEGVCLLVS